MVARSLPFSCFGRSPQVRIITESGYLKYVVGRTDPAAREVLKDLCDVIEMPQAIIKLWSGLGLVISKRC